MNPDDDITNFWLAWRELCSIRLCMNAELVRIKCEGDPVVAEDSEVVAKQARDVVETTNRYFASMIRSPRNVKALKRFSDKMADAQAQTLDGISEDDGHDEDISSSGSSEYLPTMDNGSPISSIGLRLSRAEEDPDEQVPSRTEDIRAVGDEKRRGKLVSEYIDLVEGWARHDEMTTSAFELVEIDLYREAAKKAGGANGNKEPMLKGRKLKDYLFEDIGGRPGGLCKNLWGYLLKKGVTVVKGRTYISRLRMVANSSFRNPVEDKPFDSGGDGTPNEPVDQSSLEPDRPILVRQAGDTFRTYLIGKWNTDFDVSDRVVLCCAFFEYVLSDPFVKGLVPISGSALNDRKIKRVSEVYKLFKAKEFEIDTVRALFRGEGQQILTDIAISDKRTRDGACVKLVQHFEKRKVSAGN